jgi:hypothetical protein
MNNGFGAVDCLWERPQIWLRGGGLCRAAPSVLSVFSGFNSVLSDFDFVFLCGSVSLW